MSEVEITKMSSRGQVVIPQEIREKMGLNEGVAFAVTGFVNLVEPKIKLNVVEDDSDD